jgi:type III secretion YscU/HrpY family protein
VAQGEEKTESPTEHKLRQARRRGQVAKSADANALMALLGAILALGMLMPYIFRKLSNYLIDLNFNGYGRTDELGILKALGDGLDLWLLLSLPVMGAAALGALIGNLGQFGFLLTSHPLKPDLKRTNPISGLKKMFSRDRAVELIKQFLKFGAVSLVTLLAIKGSIFPISLLFRVEIASALPVMATILNSMLAQILLCFLVIALLDIMWQRYSFTKSMRMSKYEVKKEYVQQEGDPHIKQERRRLQQEISDSAGKKNIKDSAVVITNPSHLAVAIKYKEAEDVAPRLVAKGIGAEAKDIIREANRLAIPIVRNVPLARDLQWLEIEDEIPAHLYDSVAEVLLFIHELNQKYGAQKDEN